jgi:hypothetical protein
MRYEVEIKLLVSYNTFTELNAANKCIKENVATSWKGGGAFCILLFFLYRTRKVRIFLIFYWKLLTC